MDERHIARIAFALTALTSCQSYEPRPLAPAAPRAAWHARTLEDASLREFVDRLDLDPGGAPTPFDPTDGLTLREAVAGLASHGYRTESEGRGAVVAQYPPAGTELAHGEFCRLRLKDRND